MKTDKELKAEYKTKFSAEPQKYYPVETIKGMGFSRKKCRSCGRYFWAAASRDVCGDAECSGGYTFLSRQISRVRLSYPEVWKRFAGLFSSLGYTIIPRYPVVARWRDDTLYVKASIYDFQPHVTSGLSPPPAKRLVVPQFCLRFNDVDNVGITMSHMTGFVMIGQHAFLPREEWNQAEFFGHICKWLLEELKIPRQELVFHEDAWAGGGNLGPCIEYFSGGVELGNQVYMIYEMRQGSLKELELKVLDMGMGMERVAWFTQARGTIYEATFPATLARVFKTAKFTLNQDLLTRYLPLGAMLNSDEVGNIKNAKTRIAKAMKISEESLNNFLIPLSALYSITEHTRSLLVALSDGSLPSNVGDAYNLRMLFRRAQGLIEEHKFPLKLGDIAQWHAEELKPLFPELLESIDDVKRILDVELNKYLQSRASASKIVERVISSGKAIPTSTLVELYDSHGVNPEELKKAAEVKGVKIKIPDNFYALVAARHDATTQRREKKETIKIPKDLPPTEPLYYQSDSLKFKAEVLAIIPHCGTDAVILDKTAFYPEGGGQEHDTGTLSGFRVERVEKQQEHVLHFVNGRFKVGEIVEGVVDRERRNMLSIHHTATHILNAAAREVLGGHVYQAGAKKSPDRARLDITHYQALTPKEIAAIEARANSIISSKSRIIKRFMDRAEAERLYGIRIYQGGYIPGSKVRIVEIEGLDVEACGGTHLDNTSQVGAIKILKSSKIQDSVVRLEFVAGEAALKYAKSTAELAKGFLSPEEAEKIAGLFKVPVTNLQATISRFREESSTLLEELNTIRTQLKQEKLSISIPEVKGFRDAQELFSLWKGLHKQVEEARCAAARTCGFREGDVKQVELSAEAMRTIAENFNNILLINQEGCFVFKGPESVFKKLLELGAKGGGKQIKQGKFIGEFSKVKDLFKKVC